MQLYSVTVHHMNVLTFNITNEKVCQYFKYFVDYEKEALFKFDVLIPLKYRSLVEADKKSKDISVHPITMEFMKIHHASTTTKSEGKQFIGVLFIAFFCSFIGISQIETKIINYYYKADFEV